MPLDGRQIERLAETIERAWDLPGLTVFVKDELDVDLANLVPDGSLRQRATALLVELNRRRPPRDGQLLEALRSRGNAALRAVAAELLTPGFFSPTGDPLHATVLGRAPFVARSPLRAALRDFAAPNDYSTHVLVVRGAGPGGKSYSWEFLRHLARSLGATPLRLRLEGTDYSPRRLVEQVFALLRLPPAELPTFADDPQPAHVRPLVNTFTGQVAALAEPYWLVLDDLNDPGVTEIVRETAYALAAAVEDSRPANLWVALLGYNAEIVDADLRYVGQDDAAFPDATALAGHFVELAAVGPVPITAGQAGEYADALLARHPQLTKEAMITLTGDVERMGERLRRGEQP